MFRAPRPAQLPHINTMLDDIPASTAEIAHYLGIKESTLKTYKRQGGAPRAILLALFWETRWGRAAADIGAHNDATHYAAQARALQAHQARLAGIIWRLELELAQDCGTRPANLPVFNVG